MTLEPKIALRLQFLSRVVRKECKHLATTDQRLFGALFYPGAGNPARRKP